MYCFTSVLNLFLGARGERGADGRFTAADKREVIESVRRYFKNEEQLQEAEIGQLRKAVGTLMGEVIAERKEIEELKSIQANTTTHVVHHHPRVHRRVHLLSGRNPVNSQATFVLNQQVEAPVVHIPSTVVRHHHNHHGTPFAVVSPVQPTAVVEVSNTPREMSLEQLNKAFPGKPSLGL